MASKTRKCAFFICVIFCRFVIFQRFCSHQKWYCDRQWVTYCIFSISYSLYAAYNMLKMNNFVVLQHESLMISSSEHPSTYCSCYEYVDGSSKGFVMPYYSIKDFWLYHHWNQWRVQWRVDVAYKDSIFCLQLKNMI